jgi:murein DD-endopeptidase MepM/ murein hydrolase activator NlpD
MFPVRRPFWKEFNRRLTIMIVPHGTARPRQVTFSVPFALFLFAFWTGFTVWSAIIVSEKFDYWRAKTDSHLMKIKVDYFSGELKRSEEMLDQVRKMDRQLRTLLSLGSREAIIQSSDDPAAGGPTTMDTALLGRTLEGGPASPTLRDISMEVRLFREEIQSRIVSFRDISDNIDRERQAFRYTPRGWPVNGYVTSPFGYRINPLSGIPEIHEGMDIAGPSGLPIRATADGVVLFAGWASGYGKVVVIDNLYEGYTTRFGHNRQLLVRRGERIRRGQVVSLMGDTGSTTGPHCHYEIRQRGRALNPRSFLGPGDF